MSPTAAWRQISLEQGLSEDLSPSVLAEVRSLVTPNRHVTMRQTTETQEEIARAS
jgi:hypothetical protein